MKAVASILRQKGVITKITAVDNQSSDLSIGDELKKLGVEVLSISEPFNYSRLNNLGVRESQIGKDCELLLLVNNDVELEEGALEEMCRWIKQPHIGMVGCRLHYPNGLLQHGGIELNPKGPTFQMSWLHVEKNLPFEFLGMTRIIRLVDAVTAACVVINRKIYLEVGGLDEVWHPVAYSDTDLAEKLRSKGLYCIYTPYATGVHYESITRTFDNIEDYEASRWLHELRQHKN